LIIGQSSGSSGNNFAAGLFAAANALTAKTAVSTSTSPNSPGGNGAATNITLSPEAAARLESDKAAAETLANAVSGADTAAVEDRSKDLGFDDIFDIAEREKPTRTESDDGVLKAVPEAEMRATMKEATQKFWVGIIERKNPENAAALNEALANGTVRIRNASDVPGANVRTEVTYTDDGQGMRTSKTGTPSADIQAELDAGRALLTWKHGVGDLYITW